MSKSGGPTTQSMMDSADHCHFGQRTAPVYLNRGSNGEGVLSAHDWKDLPGFQKIRLHYLGSRW